jgi:hypothetical protein
MEDATMTITKLEWHQGHHHRPTGPIAVVRDCLDQDNGATYWASLPKGMTLSDVIDDYVNSAEYDRPCPCSVALYADMQSWEQGGQPLSRKRVVVGALDE